MKLDMRIKDDLKTVALGTSKINYMDPRITVAWCKRHEVPIEKVSSSLILNWILYIMQFNQIVKIDQSIWMELLKISFFGFTFLTDIQQISSCKICMGNGCEHGLSILMFGNNQLENKLIAP